VTDDPDARPNMPYTLSIGSVIFKSRDVSNRYRHVTLPLGGPCSRSARSQRSPQDCLQDSASQGSVVLVRKYFKYTDFVSVWIQRAVLKRLGSHTSKTVTNSGDFRSSLFARIANRRHDSIAKRYFVEKKVHRTQRRLCDAIALRLSHGLLRWRL